MLTKKDLIGKISQSSGCSKAEAEKIIEKTLEIISQNLAKGEPVRLVGFGTFEVRERLGRLGRNPQTGERMALPPTRYAAFVPGEALKFLVRKRKIK